MSTSIQFFLTPGGKINKANLLNELSTFTALSRMYLPYYICDKTGQQVKHTQHAVQYSNLSENNKNQGGDLKESKGCRGVIDTIYVKISYVSPNWTTQDIAPHRPCHFMT